MVHVNKLRRAIGRLQVKVAHPPCRGEAQARRAPPSKEPAWPWGHQTRLPVWRRASAPACLSPCVLCCTWCAGHYSPAPRLLQMRDSKLTHRCPRSPFSGPWDSPAWLPTTTSVKSQKLGRRWGPWPAGPHLTGRSPCPQCKNAEAGCLVTCPLAHRRGHQDSCPFELTACPREGCAARVPRGALAEHQRHCQQSSHHLCPLGCGATLGPAERAGHNCYRELRDAWSERQERSRTLLLCLLQRVRQVHRTTNLIRRQLAQLGSFLEEDEALLAGTPQEAAATPEGSGGAGLWRAQGQSAL